MDMTGTTLSTLVGQLTALKILQVSNNRSTGGISSELQNLTSLGEVWLHMNQFVGAVPDGICVHVKTDGLEVVQADCLYRNGSESLSMLQRLLQPRGEM
jgi:hypothetical protein